MRQVCANVLDVYAVEQTSSRFTNLELIIFVDPTNPTAGVPALSGKGAELRHLAPVLQVVWRKYADAVLPHEQHADLLLTSFSDIYSILGWKTETA